MVRYVLTSFLVVCLSTLSLQATYPNKPVKIIVHTKPGGAVDLMARQFAQIAGQKSNQSFVVVNKPGESGLLALANVYNEKPDGYFLDKVEGMILKDLKTDLKKDFVEETRQTLDDVVESSNYYIT